MTIIHIGEEPQGMTSMKRSLDIELIYPLFVPVACIMNGFGLISSQVFGDVKNVLERKGNQ